MRAKKEKTFTEQNFFPAASRTTNKIQLWNLQNAGGKLSDVCESSCVFSRSPAHPTRRLQLSPIQHDNATKEKTKVNKTILPVWRFHISAGLTRADPCRPQSPAEQNGGRLTPSHGGESNCIIRLYYAFCRHALLNRKQELHTPPRIINPVVCPPDVAAAPLCSLIFMSRWADHRRPAAYETCWMSIKRKRR